MTAFHRRNSSSGYEHSIVRPTGDDELSHVGDTPLRITHAADVSLGPESSVVRRPSLSQSIRHQDIFALASQFDTGRTTPRAIDGGMSEDPFRITTAPPTRPASSMSASLRAHSALPPSRGPSQRTLTLPGAGGRRGSISKSVSTRHRQEKSQIMDMQQGFFDLLTGDEADAAVRMMEEEEARESREEEEDESKADEIHWACATCTYHNTRMEAVVCQLCGAQRYQSAIEPDDGSSGMLIGTSSEPQSETVGGGGMTSPSGEADGILGDLLEESVVIGSTKRRKSVPLSDTEWSRGTSDPPKPGPSMTSAMPIGGAVRGYKAPSSASSDLSGPSDAVSDADAPSVAARAPGPETGADPAPPSSTSTKDLMVRVPPASSKWVCPSCTFENDVEDPVCKMCRRLPPPTPPSPRESPSKIVAREARKKRSGSTGTRSDSEETRRRLSKADVSTVTTDPMGAVAKGATMTDLAVMEKRPQSAPSVFDEEDHTKSPTRVHVPLPKPPSPKQPLSPATGLSSGTGSGSSSLSAAKKSPRQSDIRSTASKFIKGLWSGFTAVTTPSPADEPIAPPPVMSPRGRSRSEWTPAAKAALEKRGGDMQGKYSIAEMPESEKRKIRVRLVTLENKKDLLKELNRSIEKLQERLQKHATSIMKYEMEMNRQRMKRQKEMKQWDEWHIPKLTHMAEEFYDTSDSYYREKIALESLHISCFSEKMAKLKICAKKAKSHKHKWTTDDLRESIESSFHTAWKIRLSNEVPEKQMLCESLKDLMRSLSSEYKRGKSEYGKAEVDFEERKVKAVELLRSVIYTYESERMAAMENDIAESAAAAAVASAVKSSSSSSKSPDTTPVMDDSMMAAHSPAASMEAEIEFKHAQAQAQMNNYKVSEDDTYFHELKKGEQETFNSFLLDQRCKEGRIIKKWLGFIAKKAEEATLEDICDFLVKVTHTFVDSYGLSSSQYFECVRIFVFRSLLNRVCLIGIVDSVFDIQMKESDEYDRTYCVKTMWMKVLKHNQLLIDDDYWFDPRTFEESVAKADAAIAARSSAFPKDGMLGALSDGVEDAVPSSSMRKSVRKSGRRRLSVQRLSQVAFMAGGGLPFAEAINVLGELEKDSAKIRRDPDRCLHILLNFVKLVHTTATRYRQHNIALRDEDPTKVEPIGNDDLFPLIVYCTIQSRLERPHKWIGFVEQLLPMEKTTMGQGAYSLSLMKAAVQYISNAAPTDFGLDADIEMT